MRKNKNVITRINKYFPQVKTVEDAKKSIQVAVKPEDNQKGRKKDVTGCALAKACMRNKVADGAIIGIAFSYLIKGTHAVRYKTSVTVGREITSFDRHHDFASGRDYTLSKVGPSASLDREVVPKIKGKRKYTNNRCGKEVVHGHRTTRIRVMKK